MADSIWLTFPRAAPRSVKRWSDDEVAYLVKAVKRGDSLARICDLLGRPYSGVISRLQKLYMVRFDRNTFTFVWHFPNAGRRDPIPRHREEALRLRPNFERCIDFAKHSIATKGKDMNTNDEKLAADVAALSTQCICAFPCGGTNPLCPSAPQSALSTMVGGQHYTRLVIQPMEFATVCGYDFPAATILKYLSRHESKNGRQDAEKALHVARLRVEIVRKHHLQNFLHAVRTMFKATGLTWVLSTDETIGTRTDMDQYIEANGFTGKTADALRALDVWVRGGSAAHAFPALNRHIDDIIAAYDSTFCGDINHA